jgi:AcrR family transcriptional regulator
VKATGRSARADGNLVRERGGAQRPDGSQARASGSVQRNHPGAQREALQSAVGLRGDGNRRADLLVAAGRLFREKGYNGTTIRDIADSVGMRSGSPFYHFRTKHDMLLAIVLDGIQSMHEAMVACASEPDPIRRFEAMVRAHLHALLGATGRDFAAVMLHQCAALEPEARRAVQARKDAYEALWKETLDQLAAIRALTGDTRLARLLILGAMNWTTQWFDPDGPCSPDQIAHQLARLVLRDSKRTPKDEARAVPGRRRAGGSSSVEPKR